MTVKILKFLIKTKFWYRINRKSISVLGQKLLLAFGSKVETGFLGQISHFAIIDKLFYQLCKPVYILAILTFDNWFQSLNVIFLVIKEIVVFGVQF